MGSHLLALQTSLVSSTVDLKKNRGVIRVIMKAQPISEQAIGKNSVLNGSILYVSPFGI